MKFLKRLFGLQDDDPYRRAQNNQPYRPQYNPSAAAERQQQISNHYGLGQPANQLTDEQALARYRYMLKSAPPETIEQAHAEAFAQLTPEQRSMALRELANQAPESERNSSMYTNTDPQNLARVATRSEMRQPGTMERTFGPQSSYGQQNPGMMGGGGMGMGGMILTSLAAGFVGSMIANQIFDAMNPADLAGDFAQETGAEEIAMEEPALDEDLGGDSWGGGEGYGEDYGGDSWGGGDDFGGGDFGGDF
jgi:hypothetical protein